MATPSDTRGEATPGRRKAAAGNSAGVRPKASQRKGRSEKIEHVARKPVQERSRQRFERILDAMERLLQTSDIENISLYDVAREAGLPPASIHYLFPSIAALQIELGNRLLETSTADVLDAQKAMARLRNPSWQDWLRAMGRRACDHFNRSRPSSEIVLAPMLHRESKRAAIAMNDRIGVSMLEGLKEVFVVPEVPGLAHRIALAADIADVLWSRSYIFNGRIDEETFEESIRLQIAYLRTVLPETLPLRRDAGAGGT